MNEKRCQRIKTAIKEADARTQLPDHLAGMLQKLTGVVGESSRGAENQGLAGSKSELIDGWIHLGDIGMCHMAHRIALPLNLSSSELVLVQEYNAWKWGRRLEVSADLNALAIGGFLKDMLEVFADTVAGKAVPGATAPKLAVFSGHDSTLFPVLTALGAFDGKWPPYASRIQLELLRVVKQVDMSYVLCVVCLYVQRGVAPSHADTDVPPSKALGAMNQSQMPGSLTPSRALRRDRPRPPRTSLSLSLMRRRGIGIACALYITAERPSCGGWPIPSASPVRPRPRSPPPLPAPAFRSLWRTRRLAVWHTALRL